MKDRSVQDIPRKALILFTSHPAKEAARKKLDNNLQHCQSIYRAFLRHTLNIITSAQKQIDFDVIIASDNSDASNIERAYRSLPPRSTYTFIEHSEKSFDKKLRHSLHSTFAAGYQQVVVIGNDCLDITTDIIGKAFKQLNTHDIVLGPANDGGFYLLGIQQFNPFLLKNISWCSPLVFPQICSNIKTLEQTSYLLPILRDIDTHNDLKNWLCSLTEYPNEQRLQYIIACILRKCHLINCYLIPFLVEIHLTRQIWQKPPPLSLLK